MNSKIIDGKVINVSIADPFKNKREKPNEQKTNTPSFVPRQAAPTPLHRKAPRMITTPSTTEPKAAPASHGDQPKATAPKMTQADFRNLMLKPAK